nr:MAG TPA: hypothetical protein [Bacteriophage sp.]
MLLNFIFTRYALRFTLKAFKKYKIFIKCVAKFYIRKWHPFRCHLIYLIHNLFE